MTIEVTEGPTPAVKMAHQTVHSCSPLRVVTQRIASTPIEQLPHVVQFLAQDIASCKRIIAAPEKVNTAGEEATVLVHKLKSQISTLLQDKSPYAKYAAVILIKATIESGGWNVLQSVGVWVRSLISILGRPEPQSTKKLCIVTLTRIFLLTQDHQSLVREITTPSLASFVTNCLNLVKPSDSFKTVQYLLPCILQSLSELITLHPTIFRPFFTQLQSLILPLMAPTPSNRELVAPKRGRRKVEVPLSRQMAANRLFARMHPPRAKGNVPEWSKALDDAVVSIHNTADRVFRAVIEDIPLRASSTASFKGVVCDLRPGPVSYPPWTGIHAGLERLNGQLSGLSSFVTMRTDAEVELPIGRLTNVIDRILSVVQPSLTRKVSGRKEISGEETEALLAGLPKLHLTAMKLILEMLQKLGKSSASTSYFSLDKILWVFEHEGDDDIIRTAVYNISACVHEIFGASLPLSYSQLLSKTMKRACEDLLPLDERFEEGKEAAKTRKRDWFGRVVPTRVELAAQELLPYGIRCLAPHLITLAARVQVDRTAFLNFDEKTMLFSITNPPSTAQGRKATSGLLPLLVRAKPENMPLQRFLYHWTRDTNEEARWDSDRASDRFMRSFIQNSGRTPGETPISDGDSKVHSAAIDQYRLEVASALAKHKQMTRSSDANASSTVLNVSRKRNLESGSVSPYGSPELNTPSFESFVASELASLNKKLRFTEDANGPVVKTGPTSQAPSEQSLGEKAKASVTITPVVKPVSGTHDDREKEDSDESDFIMPTLNLDDDTDEEEGEGHEDAK